MITVDQALACYAESIAPLATQFLAVDEALQHVLAAQPAAAVDLPPFAQAAVDGYALRSTDVVAASASQPVRLKIGGEIAAGVHDGVPPVPAAQCLRVLTGAPLPSNCDVVVMQENVRREGDSIVVSGAVTAGRGLNKRAEELPAGAALGRLGQRITPGLQAALAKAGVSRVEVYRQPRISVLVTGDEIVPLGAATGALRPGQTFDGNAVLISSWLRDQGYVAPSIRYVGDDPAAIEAAIGQALDGCDLVITNGGTSVGDRDYVRAAAERLGATPVFWRVAQQPGKPLYFARRRRVLLLGLPGNPGAVLIGLVMHARRILDCLEGVATPGPILLPGRLAQPVTSDGSRERLVRAGREITADGVLLTPLPGQAAHMVSNLQTADTLVRVPPGGQPLAAGTLVYWTPL